MKTIDNYFNSNICDSRPDSNYNKEQLELGKETELEHTDNLIIAKMIAKDHLDEIPDYYTRLHAMEKTAKTTNDIGELWDDKVSEAVELIK